MNVILAGGDGIKDVCMLRVLDERALMSSFNPFKKVLNIAKVACFLFRQQVL
jgi:hypothetical protein